MKKRKRILVQQDYDIIVVGGGLVGCSFVLAMQELGLKMAILETHLPAATAKTHVDSRPISLAYASQVILETLGVWEKLHHLACPIREVHVSEKKRFGSLCFRAREQGVHALGYVVPFAALQQTLYQQSASQKGVDILSIKQINSIQFNSKGVDVFFENVNGEQKISATLLIASDGAHSSCRKLLNIDASQKSDEETALITRLDLQQQHRYVAYERFCQEGILAVLPLPDRMQCRLVWTLPNAFASQVLKWSNSQFLSFLQESFGDRLGEIVRMGQIKHYPLETIIAAEQIRPSVVLLGNAAHTIYPIAAQGFNLGLRDVAVLAEVLADALERHRSIGELEILQRYLAWRSQDQRVIIELTRGVTRAFSLKLPMLGRVRGIALLATALSSPIKNRLALRFMGLAGKVPKLARGIALNA